MSIELQEIVATLQEEKTRYDQLIATSMDSLNQLRSRSTREAQINQQEWEDTIQRMENEVQMLRSLVDHIYFKLKILTLNNYAS